MPLISVNKPNLILLFLEAGRQGEDSGEFPPSGLAQLSCLGVSKDNGGSPGHYALGTNPSSPTLPLHTQAHSLFNGKKPNSRSDLTPSPPSPHPSSPGAHADSAKMESPLHPPESSSLPLSPFSNPANTVSPPPVPLTFLVWILQFRAQGDPQGKVL